MYLSSIFVFCFLLTLPLTIHAMELTSLTLLKTINNGTETPQIYQTTIDQEKIEVTVFPNSLLIKSNHIITNSKLIQNKNMEFKLYKLKYTNPQKELFLVLGHLGDQYHFSQIITNLYLIGSYQNKGLIAFIDKPYRRELPLLGLSVVPDNSEGILSLRGRKASEVKSIVNLPWDEDNEWFSIDVQYNNNRYMTVYAETNEQ